MRRPGEILSGIRKRLDLAAVAVAAITLALFATLSSLDSWRRVEYRGFDLLTIANANGKSTLPITLVGIDEPSFVQIGKQWPWPRRLHADLITQLNRAGAMATRGAVHRQITVRVSSGST